MKMENGDIAYLMPRSREDPPALRTMPFQEGKDDEDWHARKSYDMQ
jgi:hypothetical protein